jgi:hypothetical protein
MNGKAQSELADQQRAMLAALLGPFESHALEGRVSQSAPARLRGLRAYRSNGHALAERALTAAFPVVTQLLGPDNLQGLARAFWQAHPPARGDIAQWGAQLPAYIESLVQLNDEPFLADVARVEWALHEAATAADAEVDPGSLRLLLAVEPTHIRLLAAPGVRVTVSAWPVVSLINAHLIGEPSLEDAARRLARGVAETALVWRQGFKPCLMDIASGTHAMAEAMVAGQSLAQSLDAAVAADSSFNFQFWLAQAVQTGLVVGATPVPATSEIRS